MVTPEVVDRPVLSVDGVAGSARRSWMRTRLPAGSRNGAVADAVRLLGRLLDDLGVAGLHLLERAVEVVRWPG